MCPLHSTSSITDRSHSLLLTDGMAFFTLNLFPSVEFASSVSLNELVTQPLPPQEKKIIVSHRHSFLGLLTPPGQSVSQSCQQQHPCLAASEGRRSVSITFRLVAPEWSREAKCSPYIYAAKNVSSTAAMFPSVLGLCCPAIRNVSQTETVMMTSYPTRVKEQIIFLHAFHSSGSKHFMHFH